MRLTFGNDWTATVTGEPLCVVPRFDFSSIRVRLASYTNLEERERFLQNTFGSQG